MRHEAISMAVAAKDIKNSNFMACVSKRVSKIIKIPELFHLFFDNVTPMRTRNRGRNVTLYSANPVGIALLVALGEVRQDSWCEFDDFKLEELLA
jgi:hypothetical protein